MLTKEFISSKFAELQKDIADALTMHDGKSHFTKDPWERPKGGGGITMVMENGALIEKGGVNFSAVSGDTPALIKLNEAPNSSTFFATGLSIVLHPQNPHVPIIHMNIRYFETDDGKWWFGGGIDLTPHYIDLEDAVFFHRSLKQVCDKYNPSYYRDFKVQADDYFFIGHRNETRGIGGIFFDRLGGKENKQQLFDFTLEVGQSFFPIYQQISQKHRHDTFTPQQHDWQLLRRGRYVEFNLAIDRGTRFGLETNGRAESILMSLPPAASWQYNIIPDQGTAEHETLTYLHKNIDWINK